MIGKNIRFYRKERGYTQGELAEALGVSVQAVSKWETEAGMPDVSQIVPLSRILGVSSDELLGINEKENKEEWMRLQEEIGNHPVYISLTEAKRIYGLASPFFEKYPNHPGAALWCLESLAVLLRNDPSYADGLKECRRYENCILRFETDPDRRFKSYYVLAKCYSLLGEEERSYEMLEKIPYMYGDRDYWEGEFAYAEGDYDTALQKIKTAFHDKARFISRCIRLVRMISEDTKGKDALAEQLRLNEYMLTLINAFLSGGDYLPYRMMYQKHSLLCHMVHQCIDLGDRAKATVYMQELETTYAAYMAFLQDRSGKHQLLFPENETDGVWHISAEQASGYLNCARQKLEETV